jgi:hypothetical protein
MFDGLLDVLSKLELRCWEMFVETFQRLHMAVGSKQDPTAGIV